MSYRNQKFSSSILLALKRRLDRTNDIGAGVIVGADSWISGCTLEGDISIGKKCKLYKCELSGNIAIDRYCSLWGPAISLQSKKTSIEIGAFCSIARNVAMYEAFHNPSRTTSYFIERNLLMVKEPKEVEISKGPILIGNDVWIGDSAIVLSGVSIGSGAVVAAGAVVTTNVPPYAIVAGNPARVIRYRFSKSKIYELMNVKWWDWSEDRLRSEVEYLSQIHSRPL